MENLKEKRVLSKEQRQALEVLAWRLENEPIRYFEPNPGAQEEFFEKLEVLREVAYFAGNKSGKTYCGAKYVVQAALGKDAAKYGLEVLYETPVHVWVGSVDFKTQRESSQQCIETLLPKAEIKKVYTLTNGIVDRIDLVNGNTIGFKTYDQGRKAWQGPVKTIVWLDEEAPADVMAEARARLTAPNAKLILTMTPLLGITNVYKEFVEDNINYRGYVFGSTYENQAHLNDLYLSTLENMTEMEQQQRIHGRFTRLEGLVYSSFDREQNLVDHYWPDKKTHIFYGGMDFGADHPTAFIICAIDVDGNIYVFNEYKERDKGIEEHALGWWNISRNYDVKTVFRDPSAKQMAIEFRSLKEARLRVNTKGGVNDRATGISLINTLFKTNKLFVSKNCTELIYELEHHQYKKNKIVGKDADVKKVLDDVCDALRYCVASVWKKKAVKEPVYLMPGKRQVASGGINW